MDIDRLLGGFLGGGGQPAQPSQGGGGIMDKVTENIPGGLAGGALAGGVVALMLGNKKARKMGGTALKYGGMAAVGGLAYKAWRDHQAGKAAAPQPAAPQPAAPQPVDTVQISPQAAAAAAQAYATPPEDARFNPQLTHDAQGRDMRLALVQAMISAAKADGHIDGAEHEAIMAQINQTPLAADEKGFLFDQLSAPSDPIAIANLAGDEAQATELYVASALAIDPDTAEEQRYMMRLGDALRLPDGLRANLEAQVAQAKAAG